MYEGIYLIKEREFKNNNTDIYKIGRSYTLNTRIKHYPKDSGLHLLVFCKDSKIVEKEIIKLLTKNFKVRTDYGAEYFEGTLDNIIDTIEKHMNTKESTFCKIFNSLTNTFSFKNIFNNENVTYTINKNIKNEKVKVINDKDKNDDVDNKINKFVGNGKAPGIQHTCKKCEFSTKYKSVYDKHLLSKRHYKVVNSVLLYNCKDCDINCKQRRDYDNHLLTMKHKRNTMTIDNSGNNKVINKIEELCKINKNLQNRVEQLEKNLTKHL
jgi:hypothetical protein